MATKDSTFVKFTPEQAAVYAEGRGHSYPLPLYEAILNYHKDPRDVLLDVGTGPGKVVFDLAPHFTFCIGSDTSEGMVGAAQKGAAARGLDDKTLFLQGSGESCDATISASGHNHVDLITAAMTVHWMQVPAFYAAAARALRPGGTLAIWTCASMYAHPSMRNVDEIQKILSHFEDDELAPYHTNGTWITKSGYKTVELPWTLADPIPDFAEADFVRQEWDVDGVPSGENGDFLRMDRFKVSELEKGLGSASSVIRWREAHPERAGTEEDVVLAMGKKLREVLGGDEGLVASPSTHLLLMRRR